MILRRFPRIRWPEIRAGVLVACVAIAGGFISLISMPDDAATPLAPLLIANGLGLGMLASVTVAGVRVYTARVLRQISSHANTGVAETRDARAKASRHEYLQERQLSRLEVTVEDIRAVTDFLPRDFISASRNSQVLMITSNGAGLGHLTRCLAVANHMHQSAKVDVLTLSTAWSRVESDRVNIHYFPSASKQGIGHAEWERRFGAALSGLVRSLRPEVLMFDGTVIYRPVHQAAKHFSIPLVWILRGAWRLGRSSSQTLKPEDFVNGIILPGDFALPHADFPVSRTEVPTLYTPPLILDPRRISPTEARAALGLSEGSKYVLVQLGAGNIDEISSKVLAAVTAISALGDGWKAVVSRSPIAGRPLDHDALGDARTITVYPLSAYYSAFEFVVAAAGYNTVQELVSLGVPSVLVPNEATITDDQKRRASGAAALGFALLGESIEAMVLGINEMADGVRRENIRASLAVLERGRMPDFDEWLKTVRRVFRETHLVRGRSDAGPVLRELADDVDYGHEWERQ